MLKAVEEVRNKVSDVQSAVGDMRDTVDKNMDELRFDSQFFGLMSGRICSTGEFQKSCAKFQD